MPLPTYITSYLCDISDSCDSCDSRDNSDSSDSSDHQKNSQNKTSPENFFHQTFLFSIILSPKKMITKKLKIWQNSKTLNVTKLKNSQYDLIQKQKCDKTKKKLKVWQN